MKKALAIVLSLVFCLPGGLFSSAAPGIFPDLESHWARDDVYALYQIGVISGYPDGKFYPERLLNEGELLKMLTEALGLDSPEISAFHWAFPHYLLLKDLGALPWEEFQPEYLPTRGEISEVLRRAFYPDLDALCESSFQDVPLEYPYFSSIELLHQLGILIGKSRGEFFPEEKVTRAEAAVMICRLIGREKVTQEQNTPFGPIRVECHPARVMQGGFIEVNVNSPRELALTLFFEGERVILGADHRAIIPVPLESEEGLKKIEVLASRDNSKIEVNIEVLIAPNSVYSETIELPPEGVELLSPDLLAEEREILYSVLTKSSFNYSPSFPFIMPLSSPILSPFGAERVYPGWGNDYHWGVDLQGIEGEEVKAASEGVVVLTRELYSRGKTVVIDHGCGLFTLYYHLKEISVANEQKVEKGEAIGLVGATGAVTGPHLHWEARIGKVPVNPLILLLGGF